jgi:hypothetical protein
LITLNHFRDRLDPRQRPIQRRGADAGGCGLLAELREPVRERSDLRARLPIWRDQQPDQQSTEAEALPFDEAREDRVRSYRIRVKWSTNRK